MKIRDIYNKAIKAGIERDLRGKNEIKKILKEEKHRFEKLQGDEKKHFDKERLVNPYSDTRILSGDSDKEIKRLVAGIDVETAEILLTHVLNRERKKKIDLVVSHHPEGLALAQLFDVMKLQSDLLAQFGVSISVSEQLMEKRISEIERRLLPVNHNRTVDAARILGIPMVCIHTPADNCVTKFLKDRFVEDKPAKLKDLVDILFGIPEYQKQAKLQAPAKIVSGSENNSCGKVYVDMTGGTSGSKEIFDKLASSGVSTLVGMHMSEEYLEKAKKAHLNVVIAGHISSDVLGLNLLFDEVEKEERLEFLGISGFERIRR